MGELSGKRETRPRLFGIIGGVLGIDCFSRNQLKNGFREAYFVYISSVYNSSRNSLLVRSRSMASRESFLGSEGSDDDDYLCPICFDEMSETDFRLFPCPCNYQVRRDTARFIYRSACGV